MFYSGHLCSNRRKSYFHLLTFRLVEKKKDDIERSDTRTTKGASQTNHRES